MKIHLIMAARPNIIKIAPLFHALRDEKWVESSIVHAGQHYDNNMSDNFFKDFNLPKPDLQFKVGGSTHALQTGHFMIKYEEVLIKENPDLVVVVGDVNATMAAALVAVKLNVKVAHLEAGLRSYDRTMPEEINRIVTDSVSDILWTPSYDADENLLKEGVSKEKIVRVGNIMIDSLEMLKNRVERSGALREFDLVPGEYGVVTFHRPSNVDSPEILKQICDSLVRLSKQIKLIFPIHPRTWKNLVKYGLISKISELENLVVVEPQPYIKFMNLVMNSSIVITDSGGVQEETTYLGIPCITLRENTERPITILQGTNRLSTIDKMCEDVENALNNTDGSFSVPDLWDGNTAERIVGYLRHNFL